MTKKTLLGKLAVVVLGLGLVTGCATTEQMQKLQADVARAQETADAALAKANAAKEQAGDAQISANAANSRADDAAAAAEKCTEKCSRMMEKAMAK